MKTFNGTAFAKLNLYLGIHGLREDGYHELETVFQAIDLCDLVSVSVHHRGGISLRCNRPYLPVDNRNLAYKAAEAFFRAAGVDNPGLHINIKKVIPVGAGMAGGSTDAAAVLVALNELFDAPLTPAALCEVGLTLGADVPFCIMGGAQITEGVGEELTPIPPLPDCDLVVACAGEGVSTPAAYRALDGLYGNFHPAAYTPHWEGLRALTAALQTQDLAGVCAHGFNLFETVILPDHPVARGIKETMLAAGAVTAMMSGSGPSVFGVFRKGDGKAEAAKAALEAQGIPAHICAPVQA